MCFQEEGDGSPPSLIRSMLTMSSGEAGGKDSDSSPEPARRSVGDLAELIEMPEDVIRRQMAYWVYKGVVVEVAEVVAGGGSVYELCEEQRLRMDADEVRGDWPVDNL